MAEAIGRFQELLRFATISSNGPNGIYDDCAKWLQAYVEEIGLTTELFYCEPNKPLLLATWKGSNPTLPAILLNSHYDVVPVMSECWHYDPFAAEVLENGQIFGRGTQDMKCVCIQYVEAIRQLKAEQFVPTRTIYLLFVPDEEIGGVDGMCKFLQSPQFQQMGPIALAFDEGLANPGNAYTVFYGERTPWWLLVKAEGPTGHGSRFIQHTAAQKLIDICNKALQFRHEQEAAMDTDKGCAHADMKKKKLGDVTTLNLTVLKAGVTQNQGKTYEMNVIPTEAEAGFDVRISPHMHPEEFKKMMDQWCEAEGVSWRFAEWTQPLDEHYITAIDREKNPWWGHLLDSFKKRNIAIEPEIFPAATDSRYLRQLKIPVFGFSPMKNTPILLHEHNEMLHRDIFLEGITTYVDLFRDLFHVE